MTIWPGISNGEWFFWDPMEGVDPSLCREAFMVGASVYAKCKQEGKSEAVCHVEAEKSAFTYQYQIQY
jgi:hypothetical protein